MRLHGVVMAVAVCVGSGVGAARGQDPSFALSLEAPDSLSGAAGGVAGYEAVGRLATTGLPSGARGAQGWSLSLAAEGGAIVAVSTAGTIVEELFDEGFNKTELTTGAGNEGAVSAVVLSFARPVTLPSEGSVDVIRLSVEAPVPQPVEVDGEPECLPLASRVLYLDGRLGSGQPVDNKITFEGFSYRPTLADAVTAVCPRIERPTALEVSGLDPPATVGGVSGDIADLEIPVVPGVPSQAVTAGIVLRSDLPELPEPDPAFPKNLGGVQGWSVSVATGDCFGLHEVTTAGTAAAGEADGGYSSGGFQKTEIVDPARNGGQQGAVSAIVLSFTGGNTLPPKGTELLLRLRGTLDASMVTAPGESGPPCLVRIVPPTETGLIGSGQPVQTAVTVFGRTQRPGAQGGRLRVVGASDRFFRRGDPNDDGKSNIADAVWVIRELYRQGAPTVCQDAADANDDGLVDASDAVYLIAWQFASGTPPPPPLEGCGKDPEGDGDGVGCAETQASCS